MAVRHGHELQLCAEDVKQVGDRPLIDVQGYGDTQSSSPSRHRRRPYTAYVEAALLKCGRGRHRGSVFTDDDGMDLGTGSGRPKLGPGFASGVIDELREPGAALRLVFQDGK